MGLVKDLPKVLRGDFQVNPLTIRLPFIPSISAKYDQGKQLIIKIIKELKKRLKRRSYLLVLPTQDWQIIDFADRSWMGDKHEVEETKQK